MTEPLWPAARTEGDLIDEADAADEARLAAHDAQTAAWAAQDKWNALDRRATKAAKARGYIIDQPKNKHYDEWIERWTT